MAFGLFPTSVSNGLDVDAEDLSKGIVVSRSSNVSSSTSCRDSMEGITELKRATEESDNLYNIGGRRGPN